MAWSGEQKFGKQNDSWVLIHCLLWRRWWLVLRLPSLCSNHESGFLLKFSLCCSFVSWWCINISSQICLSNLILSDVVSSTRRHKLFLYKRWVKLSAWYWTFDLIHFILIMMPPWCGSENHAPQVLFYTRARSSWEGECAVTMQFLQSHSAVCRLLHHFLWKNSHTFLES